MCGWRMGRLGPPAFMHMHVCCAVVVVAKLMWRCWQRGGTGKSGDGIVLVSWFDICKEMLGSESQSVKDCCVRRVPQYRSFCLQSCTC